MTKADWTIETTSGNYLDSYNFYGNAFEAEKEADRHRRDLLVKIAEGHSADVRFTVRVLDESCVETYVVEGGGNVQK